MQPALRLAINRLSAKPSRTILLIAAVALSAALITVVSSAMASLNNAIRARLNATVGAADLVLKPANMASPLSEKWLPRVQNWDGVKLASPERQVSHRLKYTANVFVEDASTQDTEHRQWIAKSQGFDVSTVIHGIDPDRWQQLRPLDLLAGRLPEAPGEIVIDVLLAERLTFAYQSQERGSGRYGIMIGRSLWDKPLKSKPHVVNSTQSARVFNNNIGVRIGATLTIERMFRQPTSVTVVGISSQPPLGGRPQAYMTLDSLAAAVGGQGKLTSIEMVVDENLDPETIARAHRGELPDNDSLALETTARVSANVKKNLASSQLGLVLATVLAFLTAGFIIFTGLTVDAAQQQRELAMLRCIGARRIQLAWSQLIVGALVGLAGALIGMPIGFGIAAGLVHVFREQVPDGTALSLLGVILATAGSVAAGVIGAAWPALRAAQSTPMYAMGARSRVPGAKLFLFASMLAAAGLGIHLMTVLVTNNGQVMFWSYAIIGLPAIFVGYFFLSVPLVWVLSKTVAPVLVRVMGVPRGIVERFVAATPVRYGFTAGAMMAGLALMIGLWTQGGAILRDWLEKLEFPDAFVSGISIPLEAQRKLADLPFVEKTCAITMYPVETDAFGVRALQQYYTTFIAFEPKPFFDMTNLTWIDGDPDVAKRRLEDGGAVIVAKEFQIAQGLGVGDVFTCRDKGKTYSFDIVGVVTSPGLDIVSKFFDIGEEYTQQSLHAVFGSRKDLREIFQADTINLIQLKLDDTIADDDAIDTIWQEMAPYGILDAGSGRQILSGIVGFIHAILLATSAVSVINMLIASLGVANVIINSVEQRRFELGVLRAVGGKRGMLVRMIAVEAVLIALAASILGTLMGTQLSFAAQRLHRALLGIEWELHLPPVAILLGSFVVLVICLLASVPAVIRLNRIKPRELLSRQG